MNVLELKTAGDEQQLLKFNIDNNYLAYIQQQNDRMEVYTFIVADSCWSPRPYTTSFYARCVKPIVDTTRFCGHMYNSFANFFLPGVRFCLYFQYSFNRDSQL